MRGLSAIVKNLTQFGYHILKKYVSYQKMKRTAGPSIDEIASARNQAFKQDHDSERTYEPEPSVDGIQYIVSGDRRYKLQDLVPTKN